MAEAWLLGGIPIAAFGRTLQTEKQSALKVAVFRSCQDVKKWHLINTVHVRSFIVHRKIRKFRAPAQKVAVLVGGVGSDREGGFR